MQTTEATVLPKIRLDKWPTLILLSFSELLAMGVWFSASSVVPALTSAWNLTDSGRAWLTMSVQIGFVVGALGSAILNLPDRVPAARLFAVSAILAALCTAMIPFAADGLAIALPLRFFTGLFLVGVYPVGMKIMATWTTRDRGLGIGLLVGALTLGNALPHLINAFSSFENWEFVLHLSAVLAFAGGLITWIFITEGPERAATPPFRWDYIGKILRERDLVMANLGYLGHMWELFAMWTWLPLFLHDSFIQRGASAATAGLAAFLVIGAGGPGSLIAGQIADRIGRTTTTIAAMAISGACALLVGQLYGGPNIWLFALCLIWGFAVVADSAQFSASVSELSPKEYSGTALTLQTSLGFLLTLVTIRLIPTLQTLVGWEWAFAFLALGPFMGIWAMNALRQSPSAGKLAGGRG
jgi:MFS family permease